MCMIGGRPGRQNPMQFLLSARELGIVYFSRGRSQRHFYICRLAFMFYSFPAQILPPGNLLMFKEMSSDIDS